MSVYKDKKRGTWYVSYTFKDLPTGTTKHKTKRGFKTAKAAKQWERENYSETEIRPNKTFEELVPEWEQNNQPGKDCKRHYDEHLKFRTVALNKLQIDKISVQALISWRNELSLTEYSTKTKNDTITFVKSVLTYGSNVYDIPNKSFALKRVKKTTDEIMSEMSVWTPDEFKQFLKAVDDPRYALYFEFLFWTGCRRGEGIALQKSNVQGNSVYICASQRTKEEGLKPTKTKQNRWVEIDDILAAKLERAKDISDSSYMFTNARGNSLSPNAIDNAFKKAIKKSGVKQIRIHDLRHSHASWLIGNGMNIVAVSKRLGHASIEQTLQTYTHLIKQSDKEMMQFINQSVR